MKICVLDGATTNPGDISWKGLEALGDLTVYESTKSHQVLERAKGMDALIINRIVLGREEFSALPDLKYVGALATGYNTIDVNAAKELGIMVCNVPSYCSNTVAQMTFALLLALCNKVESHSSLVREGRWQESLTMGQGFTELAGKTLGLLGCGGIGSVVGEIGKAMGMNVIVHARTPKQFPTVSLEKLLAESDVLSVHCPLTDETRGLMDYSKLKQMKSSALIVNTARGAVFVEEDLARALNEGIIAGAGIDVLCQEPPSEDAPILKAKNCLITPHIAWYARDARLRLLETVADNLRAFQQGNPQNIVLP